MGDNIANIELPVAEWVDLYTLSGITVGLSLMVENNGSPDVYICVQATQPPVDHDSYNVVQRGNGVRLQNAPGASGAWAFCNTTGGKVAVGIAQQDGFFTSIGGGSLSFINFGNSTDANLIADATFTGQWFDTTNFGIVYVSVYSDQNSAIDGLIIEQSTNGTEAHFDDVFTILADKGKNFAINPHAQYLRVRYINGSTPTAHMHIQVICKTNGLASSHRIKDDITTDDDARLVKSIISTKANDLDEYKNVGIHYPVPIAGDQLYPADVNQTYSNMYNFTGNLNDLLDNRWSPITDTTANNPKLLLMEFERPFQTSILGFTTEVGSFSNVVIKFGVSTSPLFTLLDESADSTPKNLIVAPTIPITLNRILLEFHTTNPVTITGLNLSKSKQRIAQIQGLNPSGELETVGVSYKSNLKVSIEEYGDTSSIDAFARLRISEPFTLFDSKQLHDKQPLFWDESLGGSATSVHNSTDAATIMTVTASASDYAIRQTKVRPNYQPGKSQLIVLTLHAPQQTGVTIRAGAFDGTGANFRTPFNGIFLEITENDITWNIAKNGTTAETVSQALWNYDIFDGTGPSRLTLDPDGLIIAFMDIEWLGVGRVRTGFFIQGIPRYAHFFNHANLPAFTSVYTSTPNLPLRYYIESDGTGGGTLDHICSTVISEGGIQQTGILRSVNTGVTHLDANLADTKYAMIGIRLKSAYYDITVLPEYFSMISETNDDFKWTLELNPVVAGTFTYAGLTNSSIEYALGATANTVTTPGIIIDSGFSKSSATIDRKFITALTLGSTIAGVMDTLILTVTPLSSNADIQASLTFRELL